MLAAGDHLHAVLQRVEAHDLKSGQRRKQVVEPVAIGYFGVGDIENHSGGLSANNVLQGGLLTNINDVDVLRLKMLPQPPGDAFRKYRPARQYDDSNPRHLNLNLAGSSLCNDTGRCRIE
jgi:hypothetical protein